MPTLREKATTRGTVAAVLVVGLMGLALAACGGGTPAASSTSTSSKPTVSTASTTSTTVPPPTSTTTSTVACTNSGTHGALSDASVGPSAAVTADLVLTNVTSAACRIAAMPQVSMFDPNGTSLPNSPALVAPGVTLDTTLVPSGSTTLALTWLGTGQGTSCFSNHFATIGSFAVTVGPPGQPLSVDASNLVADVAGVCSVDAIEITATS